MSAAVALSKWFSSSLLDVFKSVFFYAGLSKEFLMVILACFFYLTVIIMSIHDNRQLFNCESSRGANDQKHSSNADELKTRGQVC